MIPSVKLFYVNEKKSVFCPSITIQKKSIYEFICQKTHGRFNE